MASRWRRLLWLSVALALATACTFMLTWLLPVSPWEARVLDRDIVLNRPQWLALLGLLPVLLHAVFTSLADLPRIQAALCCLLRTSMLGLLLLALSQLALRHQSSLLSIVFIVDVSDSMDEAAVARAHARVEAVWRARGENDVQVVTFARRARSLQIPAGASHVPALRATAGAETNIQAALELAQSLLKPGRVPRLVLLSDGRETRGDALSALTGAGRVFAEMTTADLPREVAIRALDLPSSLEVGAPFEVRARIYATRATTGRLRLFEGELLNGLDSIREVELPAGETSVTFRSVVQVPGPVTYRLELEPHGADRFASNNSRVATALVPGRPTVLLIEGTAGRSIYFERALSAGQLAVETRTPSGVPLRAGELERFDFVVLSDVASHQMSSEQVAALARYVRDGGGFLMAGGDNSFGLGAWQGTPLEDILPVRLDTERRRDQPTLALALVIDKSGSMNGQKIELAKEAAAATAELLSADDAIEVIGFDSEPERIVRLQSARNQVSILRDIGRLVARGGTSIFPALDMAYQDLASARARIKHVILLTDGQSPEVGVREITEAMRAESITVSTVGLGGDVNRTLLESIARMGAGRAYFTNDPHNIPRIFMQETTTVGRSGLVEEYVRPVLASPADFLRGLSVETAPYLRGYDTTRARPLPAQVILESDLADPILARWHVGLGWSLAWTSDITNRWAVDWIRWPRFSQFWTQLVREHMRQRRTMRLALATEVVDSIAIVTVDALDGNDRFINDLESEVTLSGPQGAAHPTQQRSALTQIAPGRYQTRFALGDYGAYLVTASHRLEGRPLADSAGEVQFPYPPEYADLSPNPELLASLAHRSGGSRTAAPEAVLDPRGQSVQSERPLWPSVLGCALLLFVVDLLCRRVRLLGRRDDMQR